MSVVDAGARSASAAGRCGPTSAPRPHPVLLVGAWSALVLGAVGCGRLLEARGTRLWVGDLPPVSGHLDVLTAWAWPGPLFVGAVLVVALPRLARDLSWRPLLAAGWLLSGVWAVVLGQTRGWARLVAPLAGPHDYRGTLPALDAGVGAFMRHFTTALPGYPTHPRGHPPEPVLVLWLLERMGLHGAGWQAVLVLVAGASATASVLVTTRAVAGAAVARAAMPYLVLAPAALWVATSMDALVLGVSAAGVALVATADRMARGTVRAAAGGLLLGVCPYLSYGLAPLLLLPAMLLLRRRATAVAATAVGSAALVAAAFTAAGFWWPDGLAATHQQWAAGLGASRPTATSCSGTSRCSPCSSDRPPRRASAGCATAAS